MPQDCSPNWRNLCPAPVKFDIVIPESHRVELTLPDDLPPGPAEVIVLPASSNAAEEADGTAKEAKRRGGRRARADHVV